MASTLNGSGLLVEYQDLFSSSSTSGGMQLGSKAVVGDGREFRFVLAGGTALVPGKLQQGAAETTTWENLAAAAAALGATTVTTTSTVTVTANQWTGGYMAVTTSAGAGYLYQIKGNTAATSAVTTITLADPIQQVALTTGSRLDIILSPFASVIINPASASGVPVGVAVYPVTASQYGWVQTKGPANVLADGAITVGTALVASNGTAGAVEPLAGVQIPVGYAMTGIDTTEYGMVFLNIS
jgi:hypothetical protein